MTHTPTPWKATKHNKSWTIRMDSDGKEYPIAEMWDSLGSSKANADHIVKCVNLHDELVDSLKHCGELLENGGFDLEFLENTLKKAGAL